MGTRPSPANLRKPRKTGASGPPIPADRLFAELLAVLPEAVAIADEQECIVEWNDRAESILGWPAAQAYGKNLPATILADTGTTLADLVARCTDCTEPATWPRLTAVRQDGDRFTAALLVTRLNNRGGVRYFVLLRDITDAMLAEQQLIQAQKLEALSHLTGGLAHDFNNILGIIIGSLDVVLASTDSAEERELISASLTAARRGAEITRSLLAVARRRAVNPQRMNVNQLIEELTPLLKQSAGKNIEVVVSANAIQPYCMIDPGGLNNALLNLVINARDAMPAAGRIVVYAYSTDILPRSLMAPLELKTGTYVVIGVDDEGAGMPSEVAMHAFDPFFTTKERGQGTGLGLAMVYGFARQSGGTARIQSAPGQGTSVQIYLPAVASPARTRKKNLTRESSVPR